MLLERLQLRKGGKAKKRSPLSTKQVTIPSPDYVKEYFNE
jgi:hypothetical protein